MWLSGYTCTYCPNSIVYHESGTSTVLLGSRKTDYNAKFHGCKNYILTLLKNLDNRSLIKILPIHIGLWIGMAWYILFKFKFKQFFWIHKGILWNFANLDKNLRKREKIQKSRKISDEELFSKIMTNRSFSYFIGKATAKRKVGNAQGFVREE